MNLRESNIKKLGKGPYDVLIIGGGINGAVAAAALSGKGVGVVLSTPMPTCTITTHASSFSLLAQP